MPDQAIHESALRGVIPPLATPLTDDGEIDVLGLERLTSFVLEAGVHGLFVLGSTGEAPFLRDDQRDRVVSTVHGVNAGQVPLLAGAIDMTAPRVVEHARRAVKLGADALVSTSPFFALTTLRQHLIAISGAIEVPLVYYNIPARSGSAIDPETCADLAQSGTIIALKDSSPDFAGFRRILLATAGLDGFAAFSGQEILADQAIHAGAAGLMPGLANIDPAGYVRLYDAACRGDWVNARTEQARLAGLLSMVQYGDPEMGPDGQALAVFKLALQHRGVIGRDTTLAAADGLSPEARAAVIRTLEQAGLA